MDAHQIAASMIAARRAALAAAPSQAARVAIANVSLADAIVAAWREAKAIPARMSRTAAIMAAHDAMDAANEEV